MVKNKFSSILAIILVGAIILCCFSGCTKKPAPTIDAPEPVEVVEEAPKLDKIADHLYEIYWTEEYDDWTTPEDAKVEETTTAAEEETTETTTAKDGTTTTTKADATTTTTKAPGCAGIQNGQFRGRNYDWYNTDTDICVIHTSKTANRPHASVGVADLSFALNEDGSINTDVIPYKTIDGINDAGICIQVNAMPYAEYGELKHTETTDDDLYGGKLVRYILDNAGTVEEALELLKDKDIDPSLLNLDDFHWMLTGPTNDTNKKLKTVVLEVFPDGLRVTDKFVDNKPIITNFNIAKFDGRETSIGIGMGYERWDILDTCFDQATSVMGTFDLMEKVYFSKLYDLYGDYFWYSEFTGANLCNLYDANKLKSLIGTKKYNEYMKNYGAVYYTAALKNGKQALNGDINNAGIIAPAVELVVGQYNENSDQTWMTIETAVYDLESLTLDLSVRESQDHLHFTIE